MTIEERMDKVEAALGKQDALVIELRDAFTVTMALEARHGRMMQDHAEWLSGHDRAMIEFRENAKVFDAQMAELRENAETADARRREENKALDARIANLVSGIGEFMRRERNG
jgi:hypothetical protein